MKDAEDGVCESATGDGRRITCLLLQEDLAETERLLADNDQQGFYKHLKGTVGLGGRKARSEQFMDEDGTLLRDKVRIRERRGRGSSRPSSTRSRLNLTQQSAPYSHNGP